jgi:GTP-binding protein
MSLNLRNIAIIAHVDHGKTTLVDGMLKQTHTFQAHQIELTQTTILDNNDLEREKGITILAKNTAVLYHDTKINIIDTPGHADFAGEVERVIHMADGAVLIVDSAEGPLPQTKFVLKQALKRRLPIIVVVNKIDRSDARPEEVLQETEELFLQLAEREEDLAFPVVYAIGREGKAWNELPADPTEEADLSVLFETILREIPAPATVDDAPFQMMVSNLDFDPYKGTYAIGRVTQGVVKPGDLVVQLAHDKKVSQHRVVEVFTSVGLERVSVKESQPGDIIALTGIDPVSIGHTLANSEITEGYPLLTVSEPTLKISISANTSPLAAREGKFYTIRQIEERLKREQKINIGLRIEENAEGSGFTVAGRGELHLAVLIETLRREGYELEVGKPQVIKKIVDGVMCEPFEEVTIEVEQQYVGAVIEGMGQRKGELQSTHTTGQGFVRYVYIIPSKNLLGFRSDLLTMSRGTAMMYPEFLDFRPLQPALSRLRNGAIVAVESGQSTTFALESIQERGTPMIGPGESVYEGMVIGLHQRHEDIEMNVVKTKKLTNHRKANAEIVTAMMTPMQLSLEQALDFIEDDELLEVTPINLRVRKRYLNKIDRDRARRRTNPTE